MDLMIVNGVILKKIPKDTADRLSGILVDVASEIGLMSDKVNCVICKLHMSGESQ